MRVCAIADAAAGRYCRFTALGITVNTADDLPAAASAIAQTLIQVNTGIEQCQSGLDQIAQGETALLDAYDNLNSQAAISSISIGQQSAQLATAAASLDSSKKELEKSKDDALDKSNLNAVLTIDSLSQLLVAQNFDMPAGYVNDSNGTQYIVQVGDEIKSIDDLTNLVLMDMEVQSVLPDKTDHTDTEGNDNASLHIFDKFPPPDHQTATAPVCVFPDRNDFETAEKILSLSHPPG